MQLSLTCWCGFQAKSAGEEMARPSAPSYLQRVLDHNQTDITNAHQLLFMALHAVLLETGLQQSQQVSAAAILVHAQHNAAIAKMSDAGMCPQHFLAFYPSKCSNTLTFCTH